MIRTRRPFLRACAPFGLALLLFFTLVPVALAHSQRSLAPALVGPRQHYLALGNSLAFGFQPDLNFTHGYVNDFSANLKSHGVLDTANMGCPDETSTTLINGGCPFPELRKYPYIGAQLSAGLNYLSRHRGQVSPVTLDIGANDFQRDINTSNCSVNVGGFNTDLATLDANLTQIILPKLHNALMVNGVLTGDLIVMNYYDPYQNICPDTVPYIQLFNQHLASDVSSYGSIVDVFGAFGGTAVPNPDICAYTWMCSIFKDIHSNNQGYSVIANAFERSVGY